MPLRSAYLVQRLRIDEASFWEMALTPEQVQEIYETGAAGKCPP